MNINTRFFRIIPILYVIIGTVWIIGTEYFLTILPLSHETIILLSRFKGFFYVLLTAVLLHVLIKKLRDRNQIEQEKEKLSLLIDTMPDFVSFKDGEGKWLQINKFGAKLFELEGIDYKGKTDKEMAEYTDFYRDALIYCIDTDEEAWKHGKVSRCEEIIPMRDGSNKIFDAFKVPIFNNDGSRQGLVVIGREITALKETERKLRQSEKLSALGELSAGIVHEIRNPLAIIKGYLQLGQEKKIQLDQHINLLVIEIDRINSLVDELLMIANPTEILFENKNINSIVREVVQMFSIEAANQKTKITVIDLGTFNTYCSESKLKQVFINIMKNALEAITTNGEINISIYEKNENYFGVKIEDNGCGIEESDLQHIGDPFFTLKEKGFGLGMTVTHSIIEAHKGSIHITSRVNVGTSLEVLLPKSL
ncbi:PAS domain S-box-containing protein [Psychrobacillus sp. OK028]|uniref:ATP-binding protein n=1 Tax=Psychrobacillus sp. OK028 TaxID=1884359 RepID=UPI00089197FC|nr:ATP-binding protein [Psychrobacillus sp. OK028]SDM36674.1 PAS domain S-box-containing protein [Psychrobacillus sp. OK028]